MAQMGLVWDVPSGTHTKCNCPRLHPVCVQGPACRHPPLTQGRLSPILKCRQWLGLPASSMWHGLRWSLAAAEMGVSLGPRRR